MARTRTGAAEDRRPEDAREPTAAVAQQESPSASSSLIPEPADDDAQQESDDLPRIEHPARRLLAYVFRHYPWQLIVVLWMSR